jgi:hypothetical protein
VEQSDNGVFDFSTGLAFTITAWVKGVGTQTSTAGVVCKGYGRGGEQYCLDAFNSYFRFYIRDSNDNAYGIQVTNDPVNNLWQHLAAVYQGTNAVFNLYLNGQLVGFAPNFLNSVPLSLMLPPASLLSNQHELSIGNRQNTNGSPYALPWTGDIDDVHIYNRALNSGDIQALISAANSTLVAGTVSFSSSGSTLLGNGNIQFSGLASGQNLVANDSYRVWASTNISVPFSQWKPVATNTFGATGQFTFVIPNPGTNSEFFEITVP